MVKALHLQRWRSQLDLKRYDIYEQSRRLKTPLLQNINIYYFIPKVLDGKVKYASELNKISNYNMKIHVQQK